MPVSSTSFQDRLNRIETGQGREDGRPGTNPASRKAKRAFGSAVRLVAFLVLCAASVKTGAMSYFGEDRYEEKVAGLTGPLPDSLNAIIMPDPYTNWVAAWVSEAGDEFVAQVLDA